MYIYKYVHPLVYWGVSGRLTYMSPTDNISIKVGKNIHNLALLLNLN